jgi:hypothetical protein
VSIDYFDTTSACPRSRSRITHDCQPTYCRGREDSRAESGQTRHCFLFFAYTKLAAIVVVVIIIISPATHFLNFR